eukprot:TRINITY_DN11413_c0_g1_i1.p1 TRINITY_DN11413_c0_g1~~TRINITY_DN11413_c0_g1_i1.p1  ORF type:complete len:2819 (+),score=1069.28 TRINITY_DN11413_c0_g1_i1:88-8544(+)
MQTPDPKGGGDAEPHVGVSPNWYCSGGWREEELQRDVKRFQERIGLLETQLGEKDRELETMSEALREERRQEADSLANMKMGSERMLEQKGQQVQQLHAAIRKLNDSLRKKDQQLSVIVSHNLRADGAFTETAADLSEARVQLRHAEAELNKERMALQKLEVQVNCLNVNNRKLDDLVQQYRVELSRKDSALGAARLQEEQHERHRYTKGMEATEALGDVLAHVTRLDHDLGEQEETLLHAVGLHARCVPAVVRPGQQVRVVIKATGGAAPVITSTTNATGVSHVAPHEGGYEAFFTAGYREGTSTVFLSTSPDARGPAQTAQAVALVEGGPCSVDLAGTTVHPSTNKPHLSHPFTLYITPRSTGGDPVDLPLTSQALRDRHATTATAASTPNGSPARLSRSTTPIAASTFSVGTHSIGNTSPVRAPVVSPTIQITGATIVTHVRPISDHTHRLTIQPLTKRVAVELVDEGGVVLSRQFVADDPTPDVTKAKVVFPEAVAVGDRGVGKVYLYDVKGCPCPAPTQDPAEYIQVTVPASDPTEIGPDLVEDCYGVYLVHFVPLAVGTVELSVRLQDGGDAHQVRVEAVESGGAAVPDNFTIRSDPPGACVEAGQVVTYYIAYYDSQDRPANAAPEASELQVEVEDEHVFTAGEVRPDPNAPGGLVFTLSAEQPGETTVTIAAARGGRVYDRKIVSVGDGVVGVYDDFLLSMDPCVIAPGTVSRLVVTPVDAARNALPAFPPHVAHALTATVQGSDVAHVLVPHRGGYLTADIAAPVAPGTYRVMVKEHMTTLEVSSCVTVAARAMNAKVKGLVNRLPGIMFALTVREQALSVYRADADEAVKETERLRARIEDLKRLHSEETRGVYEACAMERENAEAKAADLKTKLKAERREQEELQERWDARELSIEKERAQRAEDRKLWLEERDRLTALDEENAAQIGSLRQQLADVQAKHRQQSQQALKMHTQHLDELRKTHSDEKLKWDLERASLEARCAHETERAEEYKKEVESERVKAEQKAARFDEQDHTLRAMKATIQDLTVQKQQLEAQVKKAGDESASELEDHQCRMDEQERVHIQAMSVLKQTHVAEIATLTEQVVSLSESHSREVESLSYEWEAKLSGATAQGLAERTKLVQERDELVGKCDKLETQLRGCQRETLAEADKAANAARLLEAEKRSLERIIDETKQLARETELRSTADVETSRSLLEHDRQLWAKEKQSLLDRVAQLNAEAADASSRSQTALHGERRTLEKERAAWAQERQEYSLAATKLTQKSEETARHLNGLLEEAKRRYEESQREWLTLQADLKAKVQEASLAMEEATRKTGRAMDELKDDHTEEKSAWRARQSTLESEVEETQRALAEAVAKHRTEVQALKRDAESQRAAHQTSVETWERNVADATEDLEAEKRRARHDLQLAAEGYEVEREQSRMRCLTLKQELENLQQELEETRSRHKLKMDEAEGERARWTGEKAALREKVVAMEGSVSELAEERKVQQAEHEKSLAAARLEVEAQLQTKLASCEAAFLQRLQQQTAEAEAKHTSTLEELQSTLERQADTHKAEMARLQVSIKEREAIAETWVDGAKDTFKAEIAALEAEVAKCKSEKIAARQRAETERAEERQRARQEHQALQDAAEAARRKWEEEVDALHREVDETRALHQREINTMNRDLQRAGLEEAEAQQEASRKELVSLRAAWQKQLAAAGDAHEKDRRAFAKERDEWRQERAKLWSERNSSKQSLETSLAEANQARDEAELLATQRIDEITRLVDKTAELETTVDDLTKRLVSKTTADQHLHVTQREDWKVERRDLQGQVEAAKRALEEERGRCRELEGELDLNQKRFQEDLPDRLARAQRCIEELQEELETTRLGSAKLQREVRKLTTHADEQLRKHQDALERATGGHKQQHADVTEALRVAQRERDQGAAKLEQGVHKINDLTATVARLTETAAVEKEAAERDYADLRSRYDDLQSRYTEHVQRNAQEAEDLRKLALDTDKTWLEKETTWTKAVAEARAEAANSNAAEAGKLEGALRSMQEQYETATHELAALRARAGELESLAETEKRSHELALERSKEKLEFESEGWGRERQHMEQQLATYKSMVGELQEKQQQSIDTMGTERDGWGAERVKFREENSALRRQVSELETTLVEEQEKLRTEIAALQQSPRRGDDRASASSIHQERLARLVSTHEQREAEWEEERKAVLAQQLEERQGQAARVRELEASCDSQLKDTKTRHTAELSRLDAEMVELHQSLNDQRRRYEHELREERDRMAEEQDRAAVQFDRDRQEWLDERQALLAQVDLHKRSLDTAVAKSNEMVRSAHAELQQGRAEHRERERTGKKSGREEIDKMLVAQTRKAQQEREAFAAERARWEDERRAILKERDDLTGELEAAQVQTRNARSDAILAHSRSGSPSHAANHDAHDAERSHLGMEVQRLKKELQSKQEELTATKTRWQQEKAEFDTFLQELDQEKERERTLQREISKMHEMNYSDGVMEAAKQRSWDGDSVSTPAPSSPLPAVGRLSRPSPTTGSESPTKSLSQLTYGAYRSVSPIPYSLEEVRDALVAQYGSVAAALSAMMKGQVFDEACVMEGLSAIGLGHCATALCASALEEARGGSLFDGLERLLTHTSQHEAALREYEQNEALDRQLAEQSRRILDTKSRASSQREGSVVVSAAEQVVPGVTVTRVQTSTTTIKSSKVRGSFPYFGVDLTDGVRTQGGKREYFGAKVVKSREAALQAGIEVGDVVKAVGGKRVLSLDGFRRVAEDLPTTAPLSLLVDRDGVEHELTIRPQVTSARPGSLSRYTKSVRVSSSS